jgi:mRNA-degrading endonuclease RelE of RelBE toxin-antitoxin system
MKWTQFGTNSNWFSVASIAYICYWLFMTKKSKLIRRFLTKPNDFTFSEIKRLLKNLGYSELKTGKTSGSRVAFYNDENQHIIRLHKPHPSNRVKRYLLDYLEKELRDVGAL